MTIFMLASMGFGTVAEIGQWDTPQFLDAVEFASIRRDIEQFHADNPGG